MTPKELLELAEKDQALVILLDENACEDITKSVDLIPILKAAMKMAEALRSITKTYDNMFWENVPKPWDGALAEWEKLGK